MPKLNVYICYLKYKEIKGISFLGFTTSNKEKNNIAWQTKNKTNVDIIFIGAKTKKEAIEMSQEYTLNKNLKRKRIEVINLEEIPNTEANKIGFLDHYLL